MKTAIIMILLAFIICSCQTSGSKNSASNSSVKSKNILMSYSFTKEKPKGCKLHLYNRTENYNITIPLSTKKYYKMIHGLEGKYVFAKLVCPKGDWELADSLVPFNVLPKRMSYIGHIDFTITNKKQLSYKYNTAKGRKVLAKLYRKKAALKKRDVISGYTISTINSEMPKKAPTGYSYKYDMQTKGKLNLQYPRFEGCFDKEIPTNPLVIGELKIIAAFQNNQLVDLTNPTKDHVYSDDLVRCVESVLDNYRPGVNESIEFNISL